MQVTAIEGIVKNGLIHLTEDLHLPEMAKVYVLIPPTEDVKKIMSPRLVNKADAKAFKKTVEVDDEV